MIKAHRTSFNLDAVSNLGFYEKNFKKEKKTCNLQTFDSITKSYFQKMKSD